MKFTPPFQVFIAVLAILLLIFLPIVGITATFTEEETAECQQEGGCMLISRKLVNERIKEAFKQGQDQAHTQCGKLVWYFS